MRKCIHGQKELLLYKMSSVMLLFVFSSSLLIDYSICCPADLSKEAKLLLTLEGIKNATSSEIRLAKKLVQKDTDLAKKDTDHKSELAKKDIQLGELRTQKAKLEDKCDILLLKVALRNEYDGGFVTALYPIEYPKLKDEDRYKKCIIALTLQTGNFSDRIREEIQGMGYTVASFCRSCEDDVFGEFSEIIHEKLQIPASCLTVERFEKLAEQDTDLMQWLSKNPGRKNLITTILKLRQMRLSASTILDIRPESDNKCLLLPGIPFFHWTKHFKVPSANYKRKLQVDLVKKYFQASEVYKDVHIKYICETNKSAELREPVGDVLLKFRSAYHLTNALKNSQGSIAKEKIFPEILNCETLSRENECTEKSSDTWWVPTRFQNPQKACEEKVPDGEDSEFQETSEDVGLNNA